MFFISKVAAALIAPLGTALFFGGLALFLVAFRCRRLAVVSGGFAIVWLLVWALPAASLLLRNALESPYPSLVMAEVPQASAAVVLGGGIAPAGHDDLYPDMGASADRVWHAARLYHAGKVPLLILAGGSDARFSRMSEAEAMQRFLLDMGVPASAMLLEENSRTTRQNAQFASDLLGKRGIGEVILVTSALHMPRAVALFRARGLKVIPVAADHSVANRPVWRLWLPSAAALDDSGQALKEFLGRWLGR
ncbi:Uncharacterized SAM-binding protein YcdF, DUF218 family [Marinobacter sp. DSM 26671]|uniref:YdcF family protein n=1 Tax=Marinobacter sp. DSM 26671 TaxID=1761793 RepID=UPI0008E6F8AE|nr:YdcF family protein [Marinobacter sp. DSM 26671]SFD95755.1 Uncharacterized SAM-binding protein YcdF, DUF218 family [Marinobacter sp. DSM 26671]